MWKEIRENGRVRYSERYEDFLTGEIKKISITYDKDNAQTRKMAQIALQDRINELLSEGNDSLVTMQRLVDEYRKDQKLTVKQSTYMRNYHSCNTLMNILGPKTVVERMTVKYIRQRFLETGKAPGTLNEHLTRFKALVRWGYKNELLDEVKFLDRLERFKDIPHKIKIQDKYLEKSEFKKLTSAMNNRQWQLVTEFMALSGLRFGEVAALNDNDVDFKNNVIHVTKTYDSLNKTVSPAKSQCSVRDVYMQAELKQVCRQAKNYMNSLKMARGLGRVDAFFHSKYGNRLEFFAYNKYMKEMSTEIIGRKITPHALRHTHASLLMEQGVSIDVISRRLGHENSKITKEVYLHVTEKLKEKDNQEIEKLKIL